MNEQKHPAHEAAVKMIERYIIALAEKGVEFTANLDGDLDKLTPIEAMLDFLDRTVIPQKHLAEMVERIRSLAASAERSTRPHLVHFALLGLAAELERRIVVAQAVAQPAAPTVEAPAPTPAE